MVSETFLVENCQIATFQELCAGALLLLLALVDEIHGQFYPVCSHSLKFTSYMIHPKFGLEEKIDDTKGSRDLWLEIGSWVCRSNLNSDGATI